VSREGPLELEPAHVRWSQGVFGRLRAGVLSIASGRIPLAALSCKSARVSAHGSKHYNRGYDWSGNHRRISPVGCDFSESPGVGRRVLRAKPQL
jgi:hypothetical protein